MRRSLYLISLLILGSACSDSQNTPDPTTPTPPPVVTPQSGTRAIIVSEGQYGYNSGSLMSVDFNGTLSYDLFKTANGRRVGDVPQSITEIDDKLYISVNNNNCIEVVNNKDYKLVETIKIPITCIPMFMEYLGDDIIAVTDQTSAAIPGAASTSNIMFIDINHDDKDREVLKGTINMPVPTFQLELTNDKLFVGCEELSVFDVDDLTESGRRVIEYNGTPLSVVDFSKLVLDSEGNLWVLTVDALYSIDTQSESIIKRVDLAGAECECIDIDAHGRYIYISGERQLNSGKFGEDVYRIDTQSPATPTDPIFTHDQNDYWTTYGMQVSPQNTIFIIRVLYGSITRARVYEYNTKGEIVNRYDDFNGESQPYFSAGVFSRFIHFTQE